MKVLQRIKKGGFDTTAIIPVYNRLILSLDFSFFLVYSIIFCLRENKASRFYYKDRIIVSILFRVHPEICSVFVNFPFIDESRCNLFCTLLVIASKFTHSLR